ncbi:hypothetical protein PAHAL_4G288100 [Panicum hallii]|jgi:hypothetical protein|uniref:Uncharacterized protein n=1 Tax=Panicum hallii TaxID=206008 RepID=A0A2T8JE82_9POAL|nr:hypothetical protein PAHAL_4G288100 [Panicum hallii]
MGGARRQGVGPVRRRGTAGARHWEQAPASAGKGGVTKVRSRTPRRAVGPASRGERGLGNTGGVRRRRRRRRGGAR